jgi:diadenosine tetraphosphate (Ap4A) HIT family hydrolase
METFGNNYVLWRNDEFIVKTPFNPHTSYEEGANVIVQPVHEIRSASRDPDLAGRVFTIAAKVARIMEDTEIAPWTNIQSNGNWGLLPDATPFFHVYVYGRNQTKRWGKPIIIPEAPKTYSHDPMPEADRIRLAEAFKHAL